jgi:hypothetical protein
VSTAREQQEAAVDVPCGSPFLTHSQLMMWLACVWACRAVLLLAVPHAVFRCHCSWQGASCEEVPVSNRLTP